MNIAQENTYVVLSLRLQSTLDKEISCQGLIEAKIDNGVLCLGASKLGAQIN